MTTESFEQQKADVELTQPDMDRLRGSADELLGRLRDGYGVAKAGDAKRLLTKLKRQRDKLQHKIDKELETFQDEWSERLHQEDTSSR